MKLIDWIAVLGALAWLPHLIRLGHQFFTRPKLRIITGVAPELGFTTYGPILNMRLAFVVEHKDLVISGMRILLRHESGPSHVFAWQGLTQTLGTLSNPQMGNMPFQKEANVLALKAKVADVDERFVRFQSVEFLSGKQPVEAKASSRIMYLQRQGKEIDVEALLRCDEMTDLYAYIKRAFPWKQGSYSLSFEIDSPQSFSIVGDAYNFSLTQVDVEELEKNTAQVERDYRERFIPRKEGEPALVWVWRYPKLVAEET
ncbi:MAG TPA: hypothetical protein VFS24_04555 [Steroidobacteraceae bacterium]|nr:hypothetical protein [Steroidobacteraceae bacterium]